VVTFLWCDYVPLQVVKERMQAGDGVILVTHQPLWLMDWFNGSGAAAMDKNLTYLIRHHLGKAK
jgi:hypothetical protein